MSSDDQGAPGVASGVPAISRRRMLAAGAAAPLGVASLGIASMGATSISRPKRALRRPLIVNALGGLGNPNLGLEKTRSGPADTDRPDVDARAIADARASGLTAVNITLGYVAGPEDPFEYTVRTIGEWNRILREYSRELVKVDHTGDILRAQAEHKIGVIYGFQNSVQLGSDLGRIDTFADLGVSVVQLTYNPSNSIGDGCMSPQNRGLTPFGHEVVERLNGRRVMVDLSHSGELTCLDAIAVSTAPISINHTGCRALTNLPRNKTDAELRGVADKGGFVGIFFMPFLNASGHATAADVVAHIDHAVSVCGEDHVGIGTDGDVTAIDDLGAYQTHLAEEVAERAAAGISAKGERADTYPFVVNLRGPSQFHELARLLAARGYRQRRIDKILGANFLRFAREVWGS